MPPYNEKLAGQLASHINTSALSDLYFDYQQLSQHHGLTPGIHQISFKDLPWDAADDLNTRFRSALGVDGIFSRQEFHSLGITPTLQSYDPTSRAGFATLQVPRHLFQKGRIDPRHMLLASQNFNVIGNYRSMDEAAQAVAQGAASLDIGPVANYEYLEGLARRLNEGVPDDAVRLIFDVETSGLGAKADIWQLSARMVQGDQELQSINLALPTTAMDTGLYPGGLSFQDFISQQRPDMRFAASGPHAYRDSMRQFLEMVEQSDYLVGQNLSFDIEKIEAGLRKAGAGESDIAGLADSFSRAARSSNVIDTKVISAALFSGPNLKPAPELLAQAHRGTVTRLSLENIMLETSFIQDLEETLTARPDLLSGDPYVREARSQFGELSAKDQAHEAISGRIRQGMHYGDVDVWFEQHLDVLQRRALEGEDVLRVERYNQPGLRRAIVDAAAITPTSTRMPELGGLTPVEHLVKQTRNFRATGALDLDSTTGLHNLTFESGTFSRWLRGFIAGGEFVPGETPYKGFEEAQKRAMKAGLPFSGLSPVERAIATTMGKQQVTTDTPMNLVRGLMGELTGTGMFMGSDQVGVFNRGNVAVPLELIREAEEADIISSRFSRVMNPAERISDLQEVRFSPFRTRRGEYDVALVADIFDDPSQRTGFASYLESLTDERLTDLGTTRKDIGKVTAALRDEGKFGGVQIGTLSKGRGTPLAKEVYNIFREFGMDVDSGNIELRAFAYGGLGSEDNLIFTTPGMVVDPPVEGAPQTLRSTVGAHRQDIIRDLNEVRRMEHSLASELPDNPLLQESADLAKQYDSNIARRVHDGFNSLTKNFGRNALIAGVAAAGYYLYRGRKEQSQYDETLAFQGYEGPDGNKMAMAEIASGGSPYVQYRDSGLNTAGLVNILDRDKIGHTSIDAGRKNAHLFGG